jgi:hypothetical protein
VARSDFPPDEFDELPDGSPVGAHRKVPRPWTRVVVFVGVMAISLGLAWGAAQVILALQAPSEHAPVPSFTPSPEATPSPTPSPSVSVSASPSTSASP